MKPVPNAQGMRINWPNYKTGIKDIYFRMKAERGFVSIGIEVCHADVEMQELIFEHFLQLKKILFSCTQEEWSWTLHHSNEVGQTVSKIEKRVDGLNVMDEKDWPEMIAFLKPRIIALDEFWDLVKPGFEDL